MSCEKFWLHVRISQFFKSQLFRARAHRYVIEAIQKAQANDDLVCLRLALIIQAQIDLNSMEFSLTQDRTIFERRENGKNLIFL